VRRTDLFDFRRVFTLLVATVALPSIALSTFGILAIKHERAAVEKNLEDAYGAKLDALAAALRDHVHDAGGRVPALPALAREAERLVRALFPRERARFELRGPGEDPAVETVLALGKPGAAEDWGLLLVERPLEPPLEGRVLGVRLPADNSPAAIALGNQVVYAILLVIFYAAIVSGVILTSRAVYRESKLSRLKSDFVSHVSHELRTPLTSIRMFVETLRLGRVHSREEQEELLGLLDKETERLSELVGRLLDWARIESGRKVYRKVPVPAAEVARDAVAVFERQQVGDASALILEIDETLPEVEVDRDAISLVLLNLLLNAHKYTGENKRIVLRARAGDGEVRFEVEDNGPGIPKAERKRIFEQFYRMDDLLSRKTEGTGLGLAIAKRVVGDHGGRIQVHSEPGKGSRFTVSLAIHREETK
jgi:signal transduction histidine kinase